MQTSADIVKDIRGFRRLELPRNNNRLSQSSTFLVQSWRANCDIQILLYETDPLHPDPSEIAKATDYIVAYACKGVETLHQERNQMISLIMAANETFGDLLGGTSYPSIRYVGITTCLLVQWSGAIPEHVIF